MNNSRWLNFNHTQTKSENFYEWKEELLPKHGILGYTGETYSRKFGNAVRFDATANTQWLFCLFIVITWLFENILIQ